MQNVHIDLKPSSSVLLRNQWLQTPQAKQLFLKINLANQQFIDQFTKAIEITFEAGIRAERLSTQENISLN